MLNEGQQQILDQLISDPRLTPATMAKWLDPSWIPAPHLMYISMRIALGIRRGNARIIVSLPPRHGKSRLLSVGTSTWCLENFPNKNVVLTSYGSNLSEDFSSKVRDQIQRNPDKLTVRLRNERVDHLVTTMDGALMAIGLGGAITGRGADVLFIDDYIKEIKEALSPTTREYIWNWFTTTAMTRLEPDASVIIVATRWHHDDLIGKLLMEEGTLENGGDWEYIKIPAIATENDILGRKPGEALFPERYPIPKLLKNKKLLGTHFFNAIYQQDPESDETRVANAEWLRTCDELPHYSRLRWARVWDFAATTAGGDYTAGGLFAADDSGDLNLPYNGPVLYATSMERVQWSAHRVEDLVRKCAEEDGTGVPIYIEQEPGSAGKIVIANYQRLLPNHRVIGVPVGNKGGKVTRAQPLLAGTEDARFIMYRGKWNKQFAREFSVFGTDTRTTHNDMVDIAAIAWVKLIGRDVARVSWGRDGEKEDEGRKTGKIPVNRRVANARPRNSMPVKGATWGRSRPGAPTSVKPSSKTLKFKMN